MKINPAKKDINNKAPEQNQRDYAILAFVICLITGIFLLKYYRYQINPDGISYITIAKKYLAGNFGQAINGYWNPLYCWLLTPLLFIGVEPLLATKILNLLVGAPIILVISRIARSFSISAGTRIAMLLTLIPIILLFSMMVITPDLLTVLILLIYFLNVFRADYPNSRRNGLLCGIWGGIAYLAKSYCFPFIICHFSLMNVLHYLRSPDRESRKKIITNFFCGAAVFGIISGLWITALSLKYHRITYATVGGDYIMSFIRPGNRNLHPMSYDGFFAPVNQTAVNVWEDPSFFSFPKWSPFESSDAFKYYIGHVRRNIRKCYTTFKEFSYLSIPIFIAGILFLLQKPNKTLTQHQIVFSLVSILSFVWGYCMVFVEKRHIWVTFFLLIILGGYILDRLLENNFFTRTRKIALYIVFIISFAYRPVVFDLPAAKNVDKPYYLLSQEMKKYIRPGDRMASNDEWNISSYIAYHLNVPYYGIPKSGIDKETLNKELHKFNINRYLIWENGNLVNIETVQ
jgi:4-amino-4-deoxy-L-arabinose transferase-like glycosyltransferase